MSNHFLGNIIKEAKNSSYADEKTFNFISSKYAIFGKKDLQTIETILSENESDNDKNQSDDVNRINNPNNFSNVKLRINEDNKKNFIKNIITSKFNYETKTKPKSIISRRIKRRHKREEKISHELRRLPVHGRREKKKKIKNNVFRTSYSLPWADSSLWTTIARTFPSSLPNSKPSTDRATVASQDRASCQAYLSRIGGCTSSWIACFTRVAYTCAVDLGLFDHNERSKFNLLSVTDAVELTAKNTNSGLPFNTKKNSEKTKSWTKNMLRHLFRRPTYGAVITSFTNSLVLTKKGTIQALFELPALIYHRFQIGRHENNDPKVKIRQVWCVPQIIVALEAYFFYNILDHCKISSNNDPEYKYSISQNNKLISRSICRLRKVRKPALDGKYFFYSLDYSKYDRSIPVWFVDIFYAIAKESLCKMSKNEEILFSMLRLFTKYTPFIYDGEIFFKLRGISSGLFITNFYDTLFNMTLIKMTEFIFFENPDVCRDIVLKDENFLKKKTELNRILRNKTPVFHFDNQFLGDDGVVYWCPKLLKLLERICFFLGMEVSVKHISKDENDDIFYLGRFWDKDGIPDQTFEYMTDHIIFRTKYYKEEDLDFPLEDLDVMRVLSICLPLKSGKEYLNKVFYDWEPLIKFRKEKKTLHLMTGIFYEGNKKFKFDEIPINPLDF